MDVDFCYYILSYDNNVEADFFSNGRFLELIYATWVILKSRCAKVFHNKSTLAIDAVKEIWSIILYPLKGQYDNMVLFCP
jgi:hypothetical protein